VEQWWKNNDRRNSKYSKKTIFYCHFFHHKSHTKWSGTGSGLRDMRPKNNLLRHGTAARMLLRTTVNYNTKCALLFLTPWIIIYFYIVKTGRLSVKNFWAQSQNYEKRLRVSSCLSVRLSAWNNSTPTRWNFITFCISVFRKAVDKIQSLLKSEQITGRSLEDTCTFMIISRWIPLRKRFVSDKSRRENQNTHFMFNKFSRKSCRLWDNVEKAGRTRQATDHNMAHSLGMLDN
jgi:hypothetical protein